MNEMNYRFPVELEKIYTKDGIEVPNTMSVVRQDTRRPISAVSNKYCLVPHAVVVDRAEAFVRKFGKPDSTVFMSKTGGVLSVQHTYLDRTLMVNRNDVVGLRVYVENSYNRLTSIGVRVGALVLSCLNGAMTSKDVFWFTCKHVGKAFDDIRFPTEDTVTEGFVKQVERWRSFNDMHVTPDDLTLLLEDGHKRNVLTEKSLRHVFAAYTGNTSAWDVMQSATNYYTHQNDDLHPISKLNKLQRLSGWFDNMFAKGHLQVLRSERDERRAASN